MKFFGSRKREACAQVEAHLVAEYAQGSGAGAVVLLDARIEDVLEQGEILLHGLIKS